MGAVPGSARAAERPAGGPAVGRAEEVGERPTRIAADQGGRLGPVDPLQIVDPPPRRLEARGELLRAVLEGRQHVDEPRVPDPHRVVVVFGVDVGDHEAGAGPRAPTEPGEDRVGAGHVRQHPGRHHGVEGAQPIEGERRDVGEEQAASRGPPPCHGQHVPARVHPHRGQAAALERGEIAAGPGPEVEGAAAGTEPVEARLDPRRLHRRPHRLPPPTVVARRDRVVALRGAAISDHASGRRPTPGRGGVFARRSEPSFDRVHPVPRDLLQGEQGIRLSSETPAAAA